MKGCYVFCTDAALAKHLRSLVPHSEGAGSYERSATGDVSLAAEDPMEG